MSIVKSLDEAMTPVVDERNGQPSRGWDSGGFPEFAFGELCIIHAVWCAVDGGTSFFVLADNSEIAKEIILTMLRAEQESDRGEAPDARVFDAPNSWLVRAVGVNKPLQIAYETMSDSWFIPMYVLEEVAPGIRRVALDPCAKCGKPLFVSGEDMRSKDGPDYRRLEMVFERSTLGESMFFRCPNCKGVNWLTAELDP